MKRKSFLISVFSPKIKTEVRALEADSDDSIYGFAEEAIKRNIRSPYDLQQISHTEYEIKWNKFCADYFTTEKESGVTRHGKIV